MSRAFSLIELVIVVVIFAVIAAIALSRATQASRHAQAAGIAAHLRRLADAFELYHAEHGMWPPNTTKGEFPPQMSGRLRPSDFGPTPAGGFIDWQNWEGGCRPLGGVWIGVSMTSGHSFDPDLLRRIDAILDDGDLSTGQFVRHSMDVIGNGSFASIRLHHAEP